MDAHDWVTPGVRILQPYLPGKPSEELEREMGLSNTVKLASNESPLGPGPMAREALVRAAQDVSRYPDSNGYYLKEALAHQLEVEPAQLTLGNGSNDVLDLVARAFVTPEHGVIISEHGFVVFGISARAVSAELAVVPARNWGHDLDAMVAAITERTRLIYIANPNNPTGTWNDAAALERFMQAVPDSVIVVMDQAYAEYVETPDYPDCVGWLPRYRNLVVTRTFSKVHGLAAVRVGYAVSDIGIADYLNRVRHPFNVNSLGLAAATAALGDREHIERSVDLNRSGMQFVTSAFESLNLRYIPSLGNFVTVDVGQDAAVIYQELLKLGVIVRPIANYGMPRHLRISVGLPEENTRCVDALENVLRSRPPHYE